MALLKLMHHDAKSSAYLTLCSKNFQIRDSHAFEKNLKNYSFTPFCGIFPKTPI